MLYLVERATLEENKLWKGDSSKQFVKEVKRERYYDKERDLHGIYTEKICQIRTLLPSFIKVFVPASSSVLVEKVSYIKKVYLFILFKLCASFFSKT